MAMKNMGIFAAVVLVGAGLFFYYRSMGAYPEKIPVEIIFSNPKKSGISISPDGRSMAYLAPFKERLNIWVKTIDKDDDRAITTQQERDIRNFFWAYDNTHILFEQDHKGDENYHVYKINTETLRLVDLTPFNGARSTINTLSPFCPNDILVSTNKDNPALFDIYRINLQTNTCVLVAKNTGSVCDWRADCDLQVRAALSLNNTDGSLTLLYRTDEQASWRVIDSWGWVDAQSVGGLHFSRDKKKLYLIDPQGSNTAQGICLDLETGARTVLAHDDEYDIGGFAQDAYGNVWAVETQKERLVLRGLTPEYEKLINAMQQIDSGDLVQAQSTALNGQGPESQKWVLTFAHDNHSHTYYFFDPQAGKTSFLFAARPELDVYQLASVKPIVFKARDGLTIHGYLTCPPKTPEKNLPMVLYVHGGPWYRDVWGFDRFAQFLANRGYACLQVNYRGSTGYGRDFLNAGNREWGGKMHNDLVDAVKWAVGQRIADPKRVAIFGGSYGGYAALVGATFTPDLFCCAVDYVGVSNLMTFLQTVPPYWAVAKKLLALRVGDYETEEEFLNSRSPLFKVGAIKIPMLIIQGANDPRVKKAESDQIVAAMRAKKLPVEYIVFDDEGHGATGQKNNIAVAEAVEKFFAKYL